MSKKELTFREKGMIKNAAKAVYPAFEKLLKLEEKANELNAEIEKQKAFVDKMEAGIMELTGGYRSTELVKKEIILVGEGDKAIRKANYTFYYGDNVLPPEDTTAIVEEKSNITTPAENFDPMTVESTNC